MNLIECKDEQDWLAKRDKLVVTASRAPYMIGHPVAYYAEKKGLAPPLEENERMRWGKRLQHAIGMGFGEDTGRLVEDAPPYTIFLHPDAPFIGSTLDFFQKDSEKGEGILETKNVSAEWLEIPVAYQIQLQVQLACVPARKFGTVAGLRGGNTLQWQDIERHEAFIKRFVSLAEEMQWRLTHNKPPEVGSDGSEETREALSYLYPRDSGAQVSLPVEAMEWTRELEVLKANAKALDEQITLRESKLKQAINEATYGVLPDGSMWSWKAQQRVDPPRLEERVTTFRVLRRVKGGK